MTSRNKQHNAKITERRKFTLILTRYEDSRWYIAKVKEVKGAFSQGRTLNSTLKNVIDVLILMLEDQKEHSA